MVNESVQRVPFEKQIGRKTAENLLLKEYCNDLNAEVDSLQWLWTKNQRIGIVSRGCNESIIM